MEFVVTNGCEAKQHASINSGSLCRAAIQAEWDKHGTDFINCGAGFTGVETVAEVPTDPSRAFQGPQRRTVLEVVLQVATKNLPRSAGIGHLVHLFNIDPDAAEEIMGEVGTSFFVEVLPEPAPDVKTSAEDLSVQGGEDD